MASGSPTVNKIERAHQMYREGKYTEALGYYTDSLSMAKAKPQKIALHSNRAACYLKLHDFKKAAEECTSVLELDQNHTGALMLRAQTLVTLKEYRSALFDVDRLIELNPSSEMYRNLQARLKTQLPLAPIPEDEAELEEDDHSASGETESEEKEDEREGIKEVGESKKEEENMIDAAGENENRNDITELEASRNHNIKKNTLNNLDGRQSQNRKDTLILTTPDGTRLKMTLPKKKTKMRMKILSLSIDFMLKPWVLRQSNKFHEDEDNCLNSHLNSILKLSATELLARWVQHSCQPSLAGSGTC